MSYFPGKSFHSNLEYLQSLELRPGDLIHVQLDNSGHSFCQLIFGSLEGRLGGVNSHSGMPHSIDLGQVSPGCVSILYRGFVNSAQMDRCGYSSP